MLDIGEILRRIQVGGGNGRIAQELQVSRRTVSKYREWAKTGVLTETSPDAAILQVTLARTTPLMLPPRQPSSVEPLRETVIDLGRKGVECAMRALAFGRRSCVHSAH